MSAQHTSGPWLVNPIAAQIDVPGHDAPICGMLWPTSLRDEAETEANARLIAAAPELLAALEAQHEASEYARDLAELSADGTRLTSQHVAKGKAMIVAARDLRIAALAKAQGAKS